jgi:hypothetical protein
MKNLFICTALFISATIILSSCSHNAGLALTKRHYRNGYYVEYASKQTVVKPKADELANEKAPAVVKPNPAFTAKNSTANAVHINETKLPVQSGNISGSVSHKKTNPRIEAPQLLPVNSNLVEIKTIKKNSIQSKYLQDGTNADARSFFWVVITILLILWAISVLSGGWGLGGLVHLLLVIALILFILWLFRII